MLNVSQAWRETYPQACVGLLAMRDVVNQRQHAGLQKRKQRLEERLRKEYGDHDRASLRTLPRLAAYDAYYRTFRKTYHVQLQLESVIHKGRSIPSVATLVEAMFMTELKNMLLTAGHDWDSLQGAIQLDVASGSESFVAMDGESYTLKPNDMMMADEAGVITSVIYGLARRTQIRLATRNVVFTVYGAPGIDPGAVEAHLGDIRDNVLLVAPESQVTHMTVYTASHSELA